MHLVAVCGPRVIVAAWCRAPAGPDGCRSPEETTRHNTLAWRLSVSWDKMVDMDSESAPEAGDGMDAVEAADAVYPPEPAGDRPEEPWVMPREYDIGGVRWFSEASRELARALHPLLAQVTREELAEVPSPRAQGDALPAEASLLYRPIAIRHEWTVSVEDVAAFNSDQFLADLYALADSTGGQMVRGMLEHISAVTDEYGNTIDAGGRDFFDVVAETLETIDMSFDDEGRPNLTMVMHPDQAKKLRDRQPTPEQEARIDAILERRKEEWLASRRRRDLP